MVGYPDRALFFACLRLPVGRKPSSVRIAGDSPGISGQPPVACEMPLIHVHPGT